MATRPESDRTLKAALDAAAKARILEEIRAKDGDIPAAAESLGISRRGIYTWIERLEMGPEVWGNGAF